MTGLTRVTGAFFGTYAEARGKFLQAAAAAGAWFKK